MSSGRILEDRSLGAAIAIQALIADRWQSAVGGIVQNHVFISYARKDNEPRRPNGQGWVHLFKLRLEAEYRAATNRKLEVFLDEERIENGDNWENRIKAALRQSRILIAILSPNYIASAICKMELEEYIRHEQAATPGGDGVRPIYFAAIPELDDPTSCDDDLSLLIADLNRRNRDKGLNWCNWAQQGVQALLQLETEDRLADLKANPEPPLDRFVADIKTLRKKISDRLNDVALGDLARGQGNLSGSHVHFVGRGAEIAAIHGNLVHNQALVVTALHGLGGQGKSALARQYAHAFASYYAAGGRWEVECEGLGTGLSEESLKDRCTLLALAFDRLIERMLIRDLGNDPRYARLRLSPEQDRLPAKERLQAMLLRLKAFTINGWDERLAALRAQVGETHGDWPTEVPEPRILVIFDNVDSPNLMNADAVAALHNLEWLEIIVTTRLDPAEIGVVGSNSSLKVDHLPQDDAVALLREMLDGAANRGPLDADERKALRGLALVLGGFTLAVELAGAYLATYPRITVAAYLKRLEVEGIATIDTAVTEGSRAGQVASIVRHREGQVGLVLAQTLADLTEKDGDVLHLASHFAPDHVVEDWLRAAAGALHPEFGQAEEGRESAWGATLARLTGRRLLVPSDRPGTLRLHRMVRAHLRRTASAERRERGREIVMHQSYAIAEASENEATGWRAVPKNWQIRWPAFTATVETLLQEGMPDARLLQQFGVLTDRVQKEGSIANALHMWERHLKLAETLFALSPGSAQARRDLSVSQDRIGNVYLRRGRPGDADRALAAYLASLETRSQLAKENPVSAMARRDVSVSHINIADFYLRRGGPRDAELALIAYETVLKAARQIAKDNPGSAEVRRDLSVSQERIGDFYLGRGEPGDAELALAAYQASLETRSLLAKDNPDCAEAWRDLSVSQDKIGDFYLRRGELGDVELALATYQASMETYNQLAKDNPDSAEALRDLSVAHFKIGDVYLRRDGPRDTELALAAYQASLETARKLAKDNSESAVARRDLSATQSRIGDVYLRLGGPGDAERALAAYQASLETDRQLAKDNPESVQARRDLFVSIVKLGLMVLQAKDRDAAQEYLSEALTIIESFAAEGRMMDPQLRAARAMLRKLFDLPPLEGEG